MKGDRKLKELEEISKYQYIIPPDESFLYQNYHTRLFITEDNTVIIAQQSYSHITNKEYYNDITLSPKQTQLILEIVRRKVNF